MPEKVAFKTEDGITIAADFFDCENASYFVVFSHMMPATKESWKDLAEEMAKEGIASLAYDFRGHGASEGGPAGYLDFSDAEHQEKISDLRAAMEFLEEKKGAKKEKIVLVGASIGANLSLQAISEDERIKTAVLLSPGLNYRGIEAELVANKLKSGQRVMIISSADDNGNKDEAEAISAILPSDAEKNVIILKSGGHGTDMAESHPEIKKEIINFIKK